MTDTILVLSTCGSEEEARKLAHTLLEARLAACVNVVPKVQSFYWWQGRIEEASEYLLIIKTSRSLFERLRESLEAAHSYSVPEVLALPVADGSGGYLDWLTKELNA